MNLETLKTEETRLLQNIKSDLHALEEILERTARAEDLVYRFYHQSFKVYRIQSLTELMVAKFQALAPHLPLNKTFMEIVREGTGRQFTMSDNENWNSITRPMLEAFFHARYFLEMACKYGKELESAPEILPSGWAAVLYLYNLR